jgi:hypothetical protein
MTFPIYMDALEAFVAGLRSEGFDARADFFCGQVGLIVGPNGLDPKRLPPDTAGLFFPLWELNYNPNRALVEARKFHEIFESRHSGWKFDHPYQRNEDHERLNLRHWNRSASLLGNKKIEEAIQQELNWRFPPSEFPVNIDVVGGQSHTYAVVQITNFDAGIEENVKAIPEDFIGSGGMKAAVLGVTENAITDLQTKGRIPTASPSQKSHRGVPLSLRAIARAGDGSDIGNWTDVIQYEVQGLPFEERVWVANFGGPYRHDWRILRAKGGVQSDWTGHYESAEEALAVIQRESA